ncbi:MAG: hypothetical protein WA978_12055 [Sphingopyxis granuli]|uniref:hypothetical protein n=2 Tax=Sphingopyxis granuli TaxID=267128 RepID=UPI003C79252D
MHFKSMAITAMDAAGKGLAELATLSAIDSDGDTYEPGAFSWKEGGHQWAMMQPAHDRRKMPFGKARVYEDGDKAYAELHLNLKTEAGREWHQALLFDFEVGKPVQEWSFGYEAEFTYRVTSGSRIRVLSKVDVDEVSPVLRGAGVGTRTIAIKGAKLRDDNFAGLIADLGEMASAIDASPDAVSATGFKQLGEIRDAIDRVVAAAKSGAGSDGAVSDLDAAKAAVASDTALTHFLLYQQARRGRRI